MKFTIAIIIFISVLLLVIIKPRRLNEAIPALVGSVALLLSGVVNLADMLEVTRIVWNATFALIAIMIISSIMDAAGFFRWSAVSLAGFANGSGRKLFFVVLILGAVITIFFNNDGTILILTPIVYELMEELGFKRTEMIPFLFACGFIADTASAPLKVSNLVNIINSDYLGINFIQYLNRMLLPGFIAIGASFLFIYLYYRKSIIKSFNVKKLPEAKAEINDLCVFIAGLVILIMIIFGYFIGALYEIPVSIIAAIGAAILVAYSSTRKNINTIAIIKKAPWHIILFAFGMYLIVYGLNKQGFSLILGEILNRIAALPSYGIAILSGAVFSLMASFMNNLPSVMSGAITINGMIHTPHIREIMILSNTIGNDIGAKLTPIGSLATLMWIYIIREKGLGISYKEYLKAAIIIIPPILLITCLSLLI